MSTFYPLFIFLALFALFALCKAFIAAVKLAVLVILLPLKLLWEFCRWAAR